MSTAKFQLVIKPSGAILLGLAVVGIAGIAVYQVSNHNKVEAKVAAPVAKITNAADIPLGITPDMSEPEQNDKKALREWSRTPDQSHDWLLLGPLASNNQLKDGTNTPEDQAKMDQMMNTAYIPEEGDVQPKENGSVSLDGKTYSWRKLSGSAFDFKDIFSSAEVPVNSLQNVVAYASTSIECPTAQKKVIHFRSDDGGIIWLNGNQVFKTTKVRGLQDEDNIPVELRPGKNTILVKVGQGIGGWGMKFHMDDAK